MPENELRLAYHLIRRQHVIQGTDERDSTCGITSLRCGGSISLHSSYIASPPWICFESCNCNQHTKRVRRICFWQVLGLSIVLESGS
jgi:hypothetical protein